MHFNVAQLITEPIGSTRTHQVEDELGAEERAEQDPLTSDYWESGTLTSDPDRAQLTHRVKTLYGFYRLTHLVDDTEKLKEAEDKLRYLM